MRLIKLLIAVLVAYLLFNVPGVLFNAPIPGSLLFLYMLFAVITILLVMTLTDEGLEGLVNPLRVLVEDPGLRIIRNVVFVILPVILALLTYRYFSPTLQVPADFRSVHPAPPASFAAYGKTFYTGTLENPFRALEREDPEAFKKVVRDGGEVYFKNCFFCHGAKLDGVGHYAHAINPRPLSFQGTDTIAQLKESYVFWRVVKGGEGLPMESHPWTSAMPAWEGLITEDDVWKVIAFIYDYTGVRPRSWVGEGAAAKDSKKFRGEVAAKAPDAGIVEAVYLKRCSWCHGEDGDGNGPAAPYLNPPPRDFTFGDYKWKSTPYDEPVPTDKDLFATISGGDIRGASGKWSGLNGTSMPGWADMLSSEEITGLVKYLKELALFEGPPAHAVDTSRIVEPTRGGIENGKKLFLDRCSECHGKLGRGDARKRLKGDMGERTWPRNLTKPWTFRGGGAVEDIFRRIAIGVAGTQMPSFFDPLSKKRLTEEQAWDVANYVASLASEYKRPGPDRVVRAPRVTGALPMNPDDPAWGGAPHASIAVFPQLVSKERHFTPSVDSITIRALYNEGELAILIEWDDPTESIPGEKVSGEIAGGTVYHDAVSVEFPIEFTMGGSMPYFGMGGTDYPVRLWQWKGSAGIDLKDTVALLEARGPRVVKKLDAGAIGLGGTASYDNGTWKVLFKRPLRPAGKGRGVSFTPGLYTPVAFAAWDGSNGEKGARHVTSTWCWLILEKETGLGRFVLPVVVFIFVLGIEVSWALNARTYEA